MATPEVVKELLEDAQLVIGYAARAGRLPDDTLQKAMSAVQSPSTPDALPEIAPLVTALNTTIRAIAPMTLIELRAGRSPFNARRQKGTRVFFLLVLPIVLIGLVYYTELLHQDDIAVKALQQIQDARPLDKLNAVRKMVDLERVIEKRNAQYDQYHRAVTELRELQEKIASVSQLAQAVAARADWHFPWPFRWQRENSYPSQAQPTDTAAAGTTSVSTTEAVEPTTSVPSGTAQNAPYDPVAEALKRCPPTPSASTPGSSGPEEVKEGKKAVADNPWFCGVQWDLQDEFLFSTILNLGLYSYSQLPTSGLTYKIQAHMATLSGWVLPLLYGLFGSLVFLMRNMLDPRTPNVDFFRSVLRIALGGIAGIAIGWFWVSAPSKNAELVAITSAPLVLAFLAGFSIDILFALIDRVSRMISDAPGQGPPTDSLSSEVPSSSPGGVAQGGR